MWDVDLMSRQLEVWPGQCGQWVTVTTSHFSGGDKSLWTFLIFNRAAPPSSRHTERVKSPVIFPPVSPPHSRCPSCSRSPPGPGWGGCWWPARTFPPARLSCRTTVWSPCPTASQSAWVAWAPSPSSLTSRWSVTPVSGLSAGQSKV